MIKFFKIAWRNLFRNWRRTMIAVTAISLGLMLLVYTDGLLSGSRIAIYGNLIKLLGGNIQVHAQGYEQKSKRTPLIPIPNADEAVKIALAQPEVVGVSSRIVTGGFASSRDASLPVSIDGIQPENEAPHGLVAGHIEQGRYLTSADQDAVLIGKGLADRLKVGLNDRITLAGRATHDQMRSRTMTVIGIYNVGSAETEKTLLYITLGEAQTLYDMNGQVTEISIALNSIGNETPVVNRLQAALPNDEVASWQTLNPGLLDAYSLGDKIMNVFAVIVLLIAGIGILNLMLMAVFERTREIGLLSAMGLKSGQILLLFIVEGLMMGVLGAIIGCALGAGCVALTAVSGIDLTAANQAGQATALMGNKLYPILEAAPLLNRAITMIVIAGLASLYPAWQAAHREPAEALHYV